MRASTFTDLHSPYRHPEGVTAPLVLGPEGAAGCSVDGYKDLDVKDKIVLIERWLCPTGGTLVGRVRPAVAAGASNVIIYTNVPTPVTGGTLSAPDPVGFKSYGLINQSDGQKLKARLLAGENSRRTSSRLRSWRPVLQRIFFQRLRGVIQTILSCWERTRIPFSGSWYQW